MNLEESNNPTLTVPTGLKEEFPSGSNFKDKLPSYLKEIDLKAKILQQNLKTPHSQKFVTERQLKFTTQKNKLSSYISTLLETSNKMYYFLGRKTLDNFSEIAIYEYMKVDGKFDHMQISGIKGTFVAMVAAFCPRRRLLDQKITDESKPSKKVSQSSKNLRENLLELVLLTGTASGFLKTIRFADSSPGNEPNIAMENKKLDHTSIVDILILDPKFYSNANVCLALSMTNHTYLVNFDFMTVLGIFAPTIVQCEVGMNLAVNNEKEYFLQCCEGGYIIFWDINERVKELIKKSTWSVPQTGFFSSQKSMFLKKQLQEGSKNQSRPPEFKPSDIYHCISPISIFHSATITGVKFCQLYGNLLLLVTSGGLIKLIALNKSSYAHINENQFTILFEYQVKDGELISDVKFFPDSRDIFLVKTAALEGMMEKSGTERFIPVKEFSLKLMGKKNTKHQEKSYPYKPVFMKEIKQNINFLELQRSKSTERQSARCYFERISFNTELEIEKIDKVFPTQSMEFIDSVHLVEGRDLVFLRGKEFYLVGETDLFKTIEID